MISFENDYIAGAHPRILQKLVETNLENHSGYGQDIYCQQAINKIKKACACNNIDVYFTVGGTQTNQIVIAGLLHDYEGVLAAETGHINSHEAGAIEATSHKVLVLPHHDGKVMSKDLLHYLKIFYQDGNKEHMVFPGMLYISHPTEYGTLYSKSELEELSSICKSYSIPLYLDGARLGYGLMSKTTDVTLADLTKLCDVFYIGGTKVGALFGEAIVFTHQNTPNHFVSTIKRHGGLLAKGRLLGIQFDTLFTDNLYYEISEHAIHMAEMLKQILREKGYHFYLESPTNQQFILLDNVKAEKLRQNILFSYWEKLDNEHSIVRFATSWSTTIEDLETLRKTLDTI